MDNVTIRLLSATDEDRVERFVLDHAGHGPGHRRALAAIERALGNRERSLIAEWRGELVGYAPAWLLTTRALRVLHVRNIAGASLVSSGPLVSAGLQGKQRGAVLGLLVERLKADALACGAQWVRWVLPPTSGALPTLEAEHPYPLLRHGFAMRLIAGLVADLAVPEEELLRRLNATTRRRVRLAEQEGLSARVAWGASASRALQPFSGAAGTAFGGHVRSADAFRSLENAWVYGGGDSPTATSQLLQLLVVERDSEPLSAVVTCESNGTAYYFLSFNTSSGLAADSNRVALWHAMLAAKARGCRWFLLGSLEYGGGKSARISAFKQQFGGEVTLAPVMEWCARPLQASVMQALERGVSAVRRGARRQGATQGDA
jgi:hypothetical protein